MSCTCPGRVRGAAPRSWRRPPLLLDEPLAPEPVHQRRESAPLTEKGKVDTELASERLLLSTRDAPPLLPRVGCLERRKQQRLLVHHASLLAQPLLRAVGEQVAHRLGVRAKGAEPAAPAAGAEGLGHELLHKRLRLGVASALFVLARGDRANKGDDAGEQAVHGVHHAAVVVSDRGDDKLEGRRRLGVLATRLPLHEGGQLVRAALSQRGAHRADAERQRQDRTQARSNRGPAVDLALTLIGCCCCVLLH
mmetsp:Transcript_7738/g.23208  ORF Transcript_7738/g.23208 Transcript_7738/m.23208 type:complete len:251 (+) Transcript_7738:1023-1775(+)